MNVKTPRKTFPFDYTQGKLTALRPGVGLNKTIKRPSITSPAFAVNIAFAR